MRKFVAIAALLAVPLAAPAAAQGPGDGPPRAALREQCLLEHQGSAAGATSRPQPLAAPPPQNPR